MLIRNVNETDVKISYIYYLPRRSSGNYALAGLLMCTTSDRYLNLIIMFSFIFCFFGNNFSGEKIRVGVLEWKFIIIRPNIFLQRKLLIIMENVYTSVIRIY